MKSIDTQAHFERAHPTGGMTDLGCPACPGVLEVHEEGHKGYLNFECRIGHAYSVETLVEAKEDALEETLWTAVVRLDELVSVYEDFVPRLERMGRPELAAAYRSRLAGARAFLDRARALARDNRPPLESGGP